MSDPFEDLTKEELEELLEWCEKHLAGRDWKLGDWYASHDHYQGLRIFNVGGFMPGGNEIFLPLAHQWEAMNWPEELVISPATSSVVNISFQASKVKHANPHFLRFLIIKELTG